MESRGSKESSIYALLHTHMLWHPWCIPGMVGSMEGRGRTALGEDLADAAGEASRDFLDPSLVSASSFAIFSPERAWRPAAASRQ